MWGRGRHHWPPPDPVLATPSPFPPPPPPSPFSCVSLLRCVCPARVAVCARAEVPLLRADPQVEAEGKEKAAADGEHGGSQLLFSLMNTYLSSGARPRPPPSSSRICCVCLRP